MDHPRHPLTVFPLRCLCIGHSVRPSVSPRTLGDAALLHEPGFRRRQSKGRRCQPRRVKRLFGVASLLGACGAHATSAVTIPRSLAGPRPQQSRHGRRHLLLRPQIPNPRCLPRPHPPPATSSGGAIAAHSTPTLLTAMTTPVMPLNFESGPCVSVAGNQLLPP